jgi:hypothetical protein
MKNAGNRAQTRSSKWYIIIKTELLKTNRVLLPFYPMSPEKHSQHLPRILISPDVINETCHELLFSCRYNAPTMFINPPSLNKSIITVYSSALFKAFTTQKMFNQQKLVSLSVVKSDAVRVININIHV